MATDTYQEAFKAFARRNNYDVAQATYKMADIEHAYYMGRASGVSDGLAQGSYTITSLSQNNEKLLKRIAELESFGLQGESEVVKSLLLRISILQAKVGEADQMGYYIKDGERP